MGAPLRLFEGVGIELEYAIVDRETLAARPVCDALLRAAAGEDTSDFEDGAIAWSNELVLHVVELKTNGPAPGLPGLADEFQRSLGRVNGLLEPLGAQVVGGAMHPFFSPADETRLWPHEYGEIYRAYDRIFGCSGHGWSNLQSMHINLPFGDDDEFHRLHAAIRAALPLLPALAASSPLCDGAPAGALDQRMRVYRTNSRRVPRMAGLVVPEPSDSRAHYEREILGRLYDDLAPLDPEGFLRGEFANARGAIARFDRDAIEIRVLDVQECPAADLAVATATVALVRALVEGRWGDPRALDQLATEELATLLWRVVERGEQALVDHGPLLAALGRSGAPRTAATLWTELLEELLPDTPGAEAVEQPLAVWRAHGCLARRLLASTGPEPDRQRLTETWAELARCAADGRMFLPG